jgi:hypothetical protein
MFAMQAAVAEAFAESDDDEGSDVEPEDRADSLLSVPFKSLPLRLKYACELVDDLATDSPLR